jgi:hypothetical protein
VVDNLDEDPDEHADEPQEVISSRPSERVA